MWFMLLSWLVIGWWSPCGLVWWLVLSWSGSARKRSVERPVRWRRGLVESPGDASETRTGGTALPAVWREPARPCGERRRELAGHARGPGSGAATLVAVGTGRRDSPTTEGGQVTCYGLAGPVRSSRSRVIKVHGPCLPLSSVGVALSFLLSECWWRSVRK